MKAKFVNENEEFIRTLEEYKNKYQDLINNGNIRFMTHKDNDVVIIDNINSYVSPKIITARTDIRRLGFKTGGQGAGVYLRNKNEKEPVEISPINSSKQMTDIVKKIVDKNDLETLKELLNNSKYAVNINYLYTVVRDKNISFEIKKLLISKYQHKIIDYIINANLDDTAYEKAIKEVSPYFIKYKH